MALVTIIPTTLLKAFSSPKRGILPQNGEIISADAVVEELHTDEMAITDHPVELGTVISDHAFKLPSELQVTYAWSMGSKQNAAYDPQFLVNMYQTLLDNQSAATLNTIYTGKRTYYNMLIQGISVTTDRETENLLSVRITLREIIIVGTILVDADATKMGIPQKTSPTVQQGQKNVTSAPNYNSVEDED